jgi:hypothetical protein
VSRSGQSIPNELSEQQERISEITLERNALPRGRAIDL